MIHERIDWSVIGICAVVIVATFVALWALSAAVFPAPAKTPRSSTEQQ